MATADQKAKGAAPLKKSQNSSAAGKKRLLVVSQHYWPENFRINDVVEGFIEDGIEVDVLCGLPNYPLGEWFGGYKYTKPRRENHGGAEVFRSGEIRRKGNTSVRIFLNYISFPLYALFSLPRLKNRRYDAVFCYNTSPVYMMLPAIRAAKKHKVPLCTYVLDLWPDNLYSVLPLKNSFMQSIALKTSLWCYRKSPKLMMLSDAQRDTLKARLEETQKPKSRKVPPQYCVIPQYCEDYYAEEIKDEALAENFKGSFNILFAGNLSPAQDLENLIDAMAIVKKTKGGENVRVLILGDGMSRAALEEKTQKAGLADSISFLGQVKPRDIPKWTNFADALFAGLSKSDNLGLTIPAKIASYLAAGRPMLVAMDGEGARAAEESGAALVSPAADTAALAQNIITLANMTQQEREKLGAAGRECYTQKYKRSRLLKEIEDFIFA